MLPPTAMDDQKRLNIGRDILKRKLDSNKEELDALLQDQDYVNAEVKAEMLQGTILKLEEINTSLCALASDQQDIASEYEEQNQLLEIKCMISAQL